MMKDYFLSIFSRDKVNTGRQAELDWFKAFAVWAMVGWHVEQDILCYSYGILLNNSFDYLISIIGFSCAFGFMFSMGTTTIFSCSSSPDMLIRRGFNLIKIWFIINLIRILPQSIRIFTESGIVKSLEKIGPRLFRCNVLCFAGLFFLYYGFLRKKGLSFKKIILLSIVIYAAGQFKKISLPEGHPFLEAFLGMFVVTRIGIFSFAQWLPVPLIGICWGKLLAHCKNKDRLYACTGILSIIGFGSVILYFVKRYGMDNIWILADPMRYYYGNIKATITSTIIFMLLLSFMYALSRLVKWKPMQKFVYFVSTNITVIYFVHWIIIPILAELLTKYQGTDRIIVPIILTDSIFCVSCLCALALPNVKEKLKKKKTA